MKQEEIISRNSLIAKFMGWTTHPKHGEGYVINKDKKRVVPSWSDISHEGKLSDFNYHSSWDWLMPVVEKIETLRILLPELYKKGFLKYAKHGYIDIRSEYDSREEFLGWYSSASIELINPFIFDSLNGEVKRYGTKIEGMYMAVTEFIKWYNELENKEDED